jgi:uncharacterized protein (TIGR02444 family)
MNAPAMTDDAKAPPQHSPFWQFSLTFYAMPRVEPACIRLQDEAGLDVNILLFLLWNATQGRSMSEADVKELDNAVGAWRDTTVIPLRGMRRTLKTARPIVDRYTAEEFRNRIKEAELESERLEQAVLYALAQTGRCGKPGLAAVDAAQASIGAYQTLLPPLPQEPLDTILAAFAKHVGYG